MLFTECFLTRCHGGQLRTLALQRHCFRAKPWIFSSPYAYFAPRSLELPRAAFSCLSHQALWRSRSYSSFLKLRQLLSPKHSPVRTFSDTHKTLSLHERHILLLPNVSLIKFAPTQNIAKRGDEWHPICGGDYR